MMKYVKCVFLLSLFSAVQSTPYDDGKYRPNKYRTSDDGRYYRPIWEGKYVRGDEGKYTYVYTNGLYPDDDGDYRYIHQEGPNGAVGGSRGSGGFLGNVGFGGGNGGFGRNGGFGGNGGNGDGGGDDTTYNKHVGNKIYAERYPYVDYIGKSLVDQYVSNEYINIGDESQDSSSQYNKVQADKEVAVKCHYLTPQGNSSDFVTQSPPRLNGHEGSFYSFKGTKILSTVTNLVTNTLTLEYEVLVKIVDEVSN